MKKTRALIFYYISRTAFKLMANIRRKLIEITLSVSEKMMTSITTTDSVLPLMKILKKAYWKGQSRCFDRHYHWCEPSSDYS